MVIRLAEPQYAAICRAVGQGYPLERCGVLVGRRVLAVSSKSPEPPDSLELPKSPEPPELADSPPQEAYREVVEAVAVANAWEPSLLDYTDALPENSTQRANHSTENPPEEPPHGQRDRYWIDPADLLRIQKQARHQGLEIIGIYHSHPDHPAVPSECDRRLAWPVYSYLIASVRGGQVVDLQSWRLNDHQQFESEEIKILGSSADNVPAMT